MLQSKIILPRAWHKTSSRNLHARVANNVGSKYGSQAAHDDSSLTRKLSERHTRSYARRGIKPRRDWLSRAVSATFAGFVSGT